MKRLGERDAELDYLGEWRVVVVSFSMRRLLIPAQVESVESIMLIGIVQFCSLEVCKLRGQGQ